MLANLLHNLNELNSWPTVIYYFTSIEKFKNRHFCCKKTEGVYILSVPFTKDNFFINKKIQTSNLPQDLPFHRNAHLPRPTPTTPNPNLTSRSATGTEPCTPTSNRRFLSIKNKLFLVSNRNNLHLESKLTEIHDSLGLSIHVRFQYLLRECSVYEYLYSVTRSCSKTTHAI